jgi:hypothetical protein
MAYQDVPQAAAVASLPKDERRSAERRAKFYDQQFQLGLDIRRRHAHQWMRIRAIMAGVHYFEITNGMLRFKPRKGGELRAVFPLMEPLYLWGLGRLNSNDVGVTSLPATGQGRDSFARAKLAQDVMSHWIEETRQQETFDEGNQLLLTYGMMAYLRYADAFRQNVFLLPVSGSELFPIPFDARSPRELDGIMRVTMMPKQWLEMQDDLWERRHGKPPAKRMADKAGSMSTALHTNYTGFASGFATGSKVDGATVKWIWMKPSPYAPAGEQGFMVHDEIFRWNNGADPQAGPPLMNGKLPMEIVYHTKTPDDFWGKGFLEALIAPQLEANRQFTAILKSARFNTGFAVYDSGRISANDVHNCEDGFIPMKPGDIEQRGGSPVVPIAPVQMNYETQSVLGIVRQAAREAVGMESEVLFGNASGRVESGRGTGILNTNANIPSVPVIKRISLALKATYPEVLDMLRTVWPVQKTIRVVGEQNMGRATMILRDQIPLSQEVILTPAPMMANGTQAMLGMVMQLRQTPSDDGKGFEIKSREMRRALLMLGYAIPGLDLVDEAEQRIMWRIGQLIGNGDQPAIPPANLQTNPELQYENHELAVELIRSRILSPEFAMYGPAVKKALMAEMRFHQEAISPMVQPDNFEDQMVLADARNLEASLEFAESDLFSTEGVMTSNGMPIGMM